MTTKTRLFSFVFSLTLGLVTLLLPFDSIAQSTTKGASGLPIPRFVSLKAKRVNMRVGPGQNYKVSWLYTRAGIPMEIVQEYDNWRRVRDLDGTEGWVFHSLLSGERSAVAAPWMRTKVEASHINVYKKATQNSTISAKLEPGVVTKIEQCTGDWCEIRVENIQGWVSQSELWGAYPGEAFK
ncbi:SH3 domain-containing protein [Lentilitoribacter sp. EG35]|jgi:SH3-like domain-containing protein|uniref:SH3 domain-containing protein n=1 Tax=Lentilitoribacter sp. EG35 TaxID=3234192 RepID=UPI00345F33A7